MQFVLLLGFSQVALECDTPPSIRSEDCVRWSDHYLSKLNVEVALCQTGSWSLWSEESAKVPPDVARKAEQRVTLEVQQALTTTCSTQVGRWYVPSDAECFERATVLRDFDNCSYRGEFFGTFSALTTSDFCQRALTYALEPTAARPATNLKQVSK
jgi:hypothetical protein